MKINKKFYYIFGGILCLIAMIFLAVALTHPEAGFPWPNRVSFAIYALYGIYTVLVFLMPKIRRGSLAVCGIVTADFLAPALILIYIGTRNTPHENSLYLTAGLGLVFVANFANLILMKKDHPDD